MPEIKISRLIKSKRKTISLEIDKEGLLTVRAPRLTTKKYISRIILEKSNWILKKQEEARRKNETRVNLKKTYTEDEKFLFLGKEFPLSFAGPKDQLSFDGNTFMISEHTEINQDKFIIWYKKQARQIIPERVQLFSKLSGIEFNKVRISNAEKRWGSCSSKRNLNFSWRLIMAPSKVIDYVIVHELAHLVELNHSRKFWDLVAEMFPDYAEQERWLKDNGYTLELH